jgi:hypothetical protein
MAKLVTGVFKNRLAVEGVIERLIQRGYSANDISVLMTDETRTREFGIEAGTKAAEGAGIGGAVGSAVGAVLAAIAAVGTNLIIPGLGLVIAGPLAAALAGAGVGGLTGELVGALIGAGVPEYRAEAYDKALRVGGILVAVEAKSEKEIDKIEEMFESRGAEKVSEL